MKMKSYQSGQKMLFFGWGIEQKMTNTQYIVVSAIPYHNILCLNHALKGQL